MGTKHVHIIKQVKQRKEPPEPGGDHGQLRDEGEAVQHVLSGIIKQQKTETIQIK